LNKKYWRITFFEGSKPVVVPVGAIPDIIEDCEVGDKLALECIEMSEKEFKNLPEWDGP
jgi:hypothetical protein